MQRLDKFLSDSGAGTRSQVKLLLKAGRVTVDGTVVRDGSVKVEEGKAEICLDGQPLTQTGTLVVMLNKPAGFVTATEDAADKTVMELLPPELQGKDLKPVGRLDKQTEGLLLLTNDGDLLHRIISPKRQVYKVYYAKHEGTATEEDVQAFARGMELRDGTVCLPAKLEPLGPGESLITLCEGKYHQVRRMMAARGMHVEYLERREEAGLTLEGLPRGAVRHLDENEIANLGK